MNPRVWIPIPVENIDSVPPGVWCGVCGIYLGNDPAGLTVSIEGGKGGVGMWCSSDKAVVLGHNTEWVRVMLPDGIVFHECSSPYIPVDKIIAGLQSIVNDLEAA